MPHQCIACGRGFADGSRQMLSGCPDCGGNTFQFLPDGGRVVDAVGDGAGGQSGDATAGGTSGTTGGGAPGPGAPAPPSGGTDGGPGPAAGTDGGPRPATGSDDTSGPVGRVATTIGDWVGASGTAGDSADGDERRPGSGGDRDGSADPEAVLVDAAHSEDDAQAAARGSLPGPGRLFDDPGTDSGDADCRPSAPRDDATRAASGDGTTRATSGDGTTHGPDDGPRAASRDGPPGGAPAVEVDPDAVREELDSQFESIRILEPGRYVINPVGLFERDEHVIAVRENGRYVIDVAESRLEGN